MKTAPSKSLLYFLLASLFLVSAQSFLLVPQLQSALLKNSPPGLIIVCSFFFLLAAYLNFHLAFYHHTHTQEKIVGSLSALVLFFFAFFYFLAALYIEGFSLLFLGGLVLVIFWQRVPKNDCQEYASLFINIFFGIVFLLPQVFLSAETYQRALPLRWLFSLLFFGTSLLKLLANRKGTPTFALHATRLLSLPWIGWAFLFGVNFFLASLIPAILFSFAPLSFCLLPFEKFRLPDNKILGHSIFPLLSLLLVALLAIFTFLLQALPFGLSVGGFLFVFSLILSLFFVYLVMRVHYLLFELADHSLQDGTEHVKGAGFEKLAEFLFAPFQELRPLSEWQAKKIKKLSEQLIIERENAKRFNMLSLLRNQLDDFLDNPVAAQLVVNTIEKYFQAELAAILLYDIEAHELSAYAIGGRLKAYIPASYRQSVDVGTLGRAARLQKVQVINDTSVDRDYINLRGEEIGSELFIPLIHHGHLQGVLMVGVKEKGAFSAADIRILESVAQELLKTWERSGHNRRMRGLIQSSISLSTSLEPQSAIEEITQVARNALLARFVFVTLLDQEGTFTRTSSAGYAPNLQQYLSRALIHNPLLKAALDLDTPFRVRDVRLYKEAPSLPLDHNMLRGLMMIPIRLHGVSIGAVLAFGKQGGIFFTEEDESLANLLASQAAAAIESAWLIQELRSNATTTTLLYRLSVGIIQTDTIRDAARMIAEIAQSLTQAAFVGIVLFSLEHKVETALQVTTEGLTMSKTIPLEFVEQTLATGESITLSSGDNSAYIYLPIQTSLRKYGVLWLEFHENERKAAAQAQTLQTLANQAAMALERTMLLLDLRRKAMELEKAFETLENTYDQTLIALTSALDARDRETEGHSARVGNIACRIATKFGLDTEQVTVLRRGALLHDIGKIGVSDNILLKPGPLTNDEWNMMRQHPEIGARIVQDIPFLEDTMPVIRHHHERWNGSGYPLGLSGEDIPITARIFAVADVFDALTSIRPYRQIATQEEAFGYLAENSGILFDPQIVAVLESLLKGGEIEKATCK